MSCAPSSSSSALPLPHSGVNELHRQYRPVEQRVFKRGGSSGGGARLLAPTAIHSPQQPLHHSTTLAAVPPANAAVCSTSPLSALVAEAARRRTVAAGTLLNNGEGASSSSPATACDPPASPPSSAVAELDETFTGGRRHSRNSKGSHNRIGKGGNTSGNGGGSSASGSSSSPPPPAPPQQYASWEAALRALELCLASGADISAPLSSLAESSLQTLKAVQAHKEKEKEALEEAAAKRAAAERNGSSSSNGDHRRPVQQGASSSPSSFPSWSVRSRLSHDGGSQQRAHNYMRLPKHVLDQQPRFDKKDDGLMNVSALSVELPPPPPIPAFLASRALSDALLLIAMEGGPRTVRRDATVLQCVLDLLDVPTAALAASHAASGVKSEHDLVAEARRREISQIVAKHRTMLMSQEVITKMTRLEHKNGRWLGAMKLLQTTLLEEGGSGSSGVSGDGRALISPKVPPSSPMITTGIEIFAAANQWEVALKLIQILPGTLWQEAEVSGVIKSLAKSRAPNSWLHALEVFEQATGTHKVPLSAPSNINHLLGMLGRANRTEEAARIVEAFVKMDGGGEASDAKSAEGGGGGNNKALSVAVPPHSTTPATNTLATAAASPPSIEANAFTISQICVAFRHQWSRALSYASAIIARNKDNPRIVDGVALAKLTMLCSESGSWEEAMRVVKLSEQKQTPMDPASYSAIVKLIEQATDVDVDGKQRQTAYVASLVRRHHSPAVFGKVLNTLIQTSALGKEERPSAIPPTVASQQQRALRDVTLARGAVQPAPIPSPLSSSDAASSTDPSPSNGVEVLDMHYNTLLAHDCHVETASLHRLLEAHCRNGNWVEGLRHLGTLRQRRSATVASHDAVQYAMLDPRLPLAQPSWQMAVELYDSITSEEEEGDRGDSSAPHHTNNDAVRTLRFLSDDHRRRPLPMGGSGLGASAAPSSSSPPSIVGGVGGFVVPLSEIAFRSCMRLCFQQGAAEAAQKLLRTTMRRGIGGGSRR